MYFQFIIVNISFFKRENKALNLPLRGVREIQQEKEKEKEKKTMEQIDNKDIHKG